ncbi:hypothetical protein AB0I98_01610 [Streptomyces sp. NPDC050211]|uniref:hypothetical protein n=1 Tax=Streptomyces sp. NPDC050211 TaxID=3154932 RepID=UPI0034289EBA
MTRVLDLAVVTDFADTLHALPPSPAASAFDQLLAPADDAARHALAVRLLTRSRTVRVMLPRLRIATAALSAAVTRTLHEVVRDLYKPAQSDVLRREGLLLRSHPGRVQTPRVCVTPGRDRSRLPRRSGPPCRNGTMHTPGVITAVVPSRIPEGHEPATHHPTQRAHHHRGRGPYGLRDRRGAHGRSRSLGTAVRRSSG